MPQTHLSSEQIGDGEVKLVDLNQEVHDALNSKAALSDLANEVAAREAAVTAAQAAAIAASAPIAHVGSGGTSHSVASITTAGFLGASDKAKLDGVTGTNTGDETTATIKTKLGIATLSGANTGDQTSVTGNAGTATALQNARTINGVAFNGTSNITINAVDATARVASSLLGAASGVATLDATGKLTTAQIPASLVGAVVYQGTWNASTNSPALASGTGTKGFYYKVSVAGTTPVDGLSSWGIGDIIIFDGTTWDKIDGQAPEVSSVFGRTGAVALLSSDIATALGFTPYSAANPANYLTANQTITFSGDATGSGTTSVALTISNSAVTSAKLGNDLSFPGTGGVNLPLGTTAQRKTGAADGVLRYNSSLLKVEALVAGAWQQLAVEPTDLAAAQLRRTTTQALTTTQVDVTFDAVDYNNQPSVMVRDAVTSKLDILAAGVYLVCFAGETINTNNGNNDLFQIKVNGAAVAGGLITTTPRSSRESFSRAVPLYLNAGDYVSVSAYSSSGSSGTMQLGATLTAVKLQGAQGPAGPAGGQSSVTWSAGNLDNPNNANWAVNLLAPVIADTANNALLVRAFDDTAETGVGFTVYVPPTASSIMFSFTGKCATAPASAKAVSPKLYVRSINVNAAVGAWSAGLAMASLSIPTNAFYQTFTQTISLATLGITAGGTCQFELTRQGSNVADTLVGDFQLLNATLSFS